eukprot:TRINITY_DN27143_c0_g1_i1.p1 TRINITY_DN27143_c0_g1~~TRINITY_DN27143_c0_g1_i1.p1  ORF type:complete len:1771 (+),score=436.46 TRINITY_DN27143_c0_g1_i1:46-5358(+)
MSLKEILHQRNRLRKSQALWGLETAEDEEFSKKLFVAKRRTSSSSSSSNSNSNGAESVKKPVRMEGSRGQSLTTLPPPSASPSDSGGESLPASPSREAKTVTITFKDATECFVIPPNDDIRLLYTIGAMLDINGSFVVKDASNVTIFPSYHTLRDHGRYTAHEIPDPPLQFRPSSRRSSISSAASTAHRRGSASSASSTAGDKKAKRSKRKPRKEDTSGSSDSSDRKRPRKKVGYLKPEQSAGRQPTIVVNAPSDESGSTGHLKLSDARSGDKGPDLAKRRDRGHDRSSSASSAATIPVQERHSPKHKGSKTSKKKQNTESSSSSNGERGRSEWRDKPASQPQDTTRDSPTEGNAPTKATKATDTVQELTRKTAETDKASSSDGERRNGSQPDEEEKRTVVTHEDDPMPQEDQPKSEDIELTHDAKPPGGEKRFSISSSDSKASAAKGRTLLRKGTPPLAPKKKQQDSGSHDKSSSDSSDNARQEPFGDEHKPHDPKSGSVTASSASSTDSSKRKEEPQIQRPTRSASGSDSSKSSGEEPQARQANLVRDMKQEPAKNKHDRSNSESSSHEKKQNSRKGKQNPSGDEVEPRKTKENKQQPTKPVSKSAELQKDSPKKPDRYRSSSEGSRDANRVRKVKGVRDRLNDSVGREARKANEKRLLEALRDDSSPERGRSHSSRSSSSDSRSVRRKEKDTEQDKPDDKERTVPATPRGTKRTTQIQELVDALKDVPQHPTSPTYFSSEAEKGYSAECEAPRDERRGSKESNKGRNDERFLSDTRKSFLKTIDTSTRRVRPEPLNTDTLGLDNGSQYSSPLSPGSPKKLKWSGEVIQVNTSMSSSDEKQKSRTRRNVRELGSSMRRSTRRRGNSQYSTHSRMMHSHTSTDSTSDRERDRSDLLRACLSTLKKDPYGDDTEHEAPFQTVPAAGGPADSFMYTTDSDSSDAKHNIDLDKLVVALSKNQQSSSGLKELLMTDITLQHIAEELKKVFTEQPLDYEKVIDCLQDITSTSDWAGLHAHCPALTWIQRRLDDEGTAAVLHDLEFREVVWLATTTELAKLVKMSPEGKKLRLIDLTWRGKCMELEDELKGCRAYAQEMSESIGGDIILPPLRWLSAPCVAAFVSHVLFEGKEMQEAVNTLETDWKEVETLLKGQISTVHNLLTANAANQLSYLYGWKDVCYDHDYSTAADFDKNNEIADHDLLPIPKPKPIKRKPAPKPTPEDPRQELEEEELPVKHLPVEEPRFADSCVEELPNPKQHKGLAAQRWLKAGRNLRFAAFMWKVRPGINVEKSKAQSATAEPEVDITGAGARFRRLWAEKLDSTKTRKMTILDELIENIKVPRVCDTPELKLLVVSQAMHMLHKAKGEVSPKSVKSKARNKVEIFVMTLYTMAGSDLDRMMHFPSVPDPEDDLSSYTKQYAGRNSAPFREMNYSVRTGVTKEGENRDYILKESEKAWEGMQKWVKTLGLLYALCHDTYADQNLATDFNMIASCPSYYRGLAGLPDDVYHMHEKLRPGCILHWPAPSSCAKDEDVATSYVNGEATNAFKSTGGTVFFSVKGVRRGLPLQEISQYPQEAEVLVAPFTTFRVSQPQRVLSLKSSKTKVLTLEWVNTDPLGQAFIDQVFKESQAVCEKLNTLANSGVVIARDPHQGLGIAFSSNMTVMEIKSGSPAALADAQRFINRRVVDCNGQPVSCMKDLKASISVSEVVCLQFARKNEQHSEIQQMVDEYPKPPFVYAEGGSLAKLTEQEQQETARKLNYSIATSIQNASIRVPL